MAVTKNNYVRLKEEADIETVISYLQIPVTKKGCNYFIPCPNPDHADKHATNCYFKSGWNNVYCYACGSHIQAIDIIMWTLHCDYGEAADILWQIEGCPSWYYYKQSVKKQKDHFVITGEEAQLIGIHYPNHVLNPINEMSEKRELEKGKEYCPYYIDSYLLCEVKHMNYRDFMTERQFAAIVQNKCLEKLKRLDETEAFFQSLVVLALEMNINDVKSELLLQECKKEKIICRKLYRRAKKAVAKR